MSPCASCASCAHFPQFRTSLWSVLVTHRQILFCCFEQCWQTGNPFLSHHKNKGFLELLMTFRRKMTLPFHLSASPLCPIVPVGHFNANLKLTLSMLALRVERPLEHWPARFARSSSFSTLFLYPGHPGAWQDCKSCITHCHIVTPNS